MSYICIHETVQLILFQSITLTQRVSGLVYYVENNLFFYLQLQTLEVFYLALWWNGRHACLRNKSFGILGSNPSRVTSLYDVIGKRTELKPQVVGVRISL